MKKMVILFQKSMLLRVCFFMSLLGVGFQPSVKAQDAYPREYTNPDEIVAFDKSTLYVEAIEVINQFYQEYRNKFIIDQSGADGTIDVNLPAMHWEDALTFILRVKNLGLKEFNGYVEILPLSLLEAERTPSGQVIVPENQDPDQISLDTREIRINATFFEGNKRALQEVGIDWSTLTNNVPANLNEIVAGEGDPNLGVPQSTAFSDQFVSVNSFGATNVSQNVFNALVNFGEVGPGVRVQALFSAFEADNLGEVLATPSVKVMDGQQGRIQVGQDFSIKQRDIAGNVTDQFFSTGTILTVTPNIIDDNDTTFIHLQIDVERSSASPDAVSTIINKQEAETQALLLNGEATSIAGLYRTEESRIRRGVPFLKDLPPWFFGLRYLFGYNSKDYVENELIILVQAQLEESLQDRMANSFKSKRTLLDETRENFRIALDDVSENPNAQASVLTSETETSAQTLAEVFNEEEDSPVENNSTPEEQPGIQNVLTEEEEKLVEELSLPVNNPELMILVPKAFSLEEYLEQKANGKEIEDTKAKDLKYFIIAGSFIVPKNAARFNELLMSQGYETRILFNPQSRFNYVAYRGFSDLWEAVLYRTQIRRDVNSNAWLFRKVKE